MLPLLSAPVLPSPVNPTINSSASMHSSVIPAGAAGVGTGGGSNYPVTYSVGEGQPQYAASSAYATEEGMDF